MKKLLASILIGVMSASLLAGCGSSQNTGTNTNTTKSDSASSETKSSETSSSASSDAKTTIEPCTINFWHAMSGQQETTLKELTDAFNKDNKYGITVTLVNQGAYGDLSTKLTANAAADTLPELSQAYNSWLIPYESKVVKLDDFVKKDFDNYDDIIQGYRDENSQLGFISGLPFNKSTYVYFYNKTIFDELGLQAPKTWEDLQNIGKVIKDKKNMVSLGVDDMAGFLEASLKQDSAPYLDKTGALFNTDSGKETLNFILGLYNNGYARLVGEDKYFSGPFSNAQVAAYIGSSTGVSYIKPNGFELGVASLPGNKTQAANQAGTNIVMFAKDKNKQLAAWEYMKYLTSEESTLKWAMETGYLPIRTSAYKSDTYQKFMSTDPTSTAAYGQSSAFFSSATFDGSYDMQQAVNEKLQDIILNKKDTDAAMKELTDAVNACVK